MLNQKVLDQLNSNEVSEYNYNNQSYWQASDELEFKKQDNSFDTGNLTVGDLARIKDAQYHMCQKFENQMREKYNGKS